MRCARTSTVPSSPRAGAVRPSPGPAATRRAAAETVVDGPIGHAELPGGHGHAQVLDAHRDSPWPSVDQDRARGTARGRRNPEHRAQYRPNRATTHPEPALGPWGPSLLRPPQSAGKGPSDHAPVFWPSDGVHAFAHATSPVGTLSTEPAPGHLLSVSGGSGGTARRPDRDTESGQFGAHLLGRHAEPSGDRSYGEPFVEVEAPECVPVERGVPVAPGPAPHDNQAVFVHTRFGASG